MSTEPPKDDRKIQEHAWMIRPCHIYDEEHSECASIKGKFHQYFVHGKTLDCSAWKTDYRNCTFWRETEDETAYQALLESEQKRRTERLRPHYANTVWKKRETPPENWNKPLPEWMIKDQEASYLGIKAAEMRTGKNSAVEKQLCTIL